MAIDNVGKAVEATNGESNSDSAAGHSGAEADGTGRSHDTSSIPWAKLLAKISEAIPLVCPVCGGDIRPIAFITDPGPVRKILMHVGEPAEPPPVSPARGPPTEWTELIQVRDDRDVMQTSFDKLPVIDIHAI